MLSVAHADLPGDAVFAMVSAAAFTESTMNTYPVQRHMFPASAARISASDGSGFSSRRA